MSSIDANDATMPGDAWQLSMSRILAVAGHDLKQPIGLAMLSIGRAVDEGVSVAAAHRLSIALDALKRLVGEMNDVARLSQMNAALDALRESAQAWHALGSIGVREGRVDSKALVEPQDRVRKRRICSAVEWLAPRKSRVDGISLQDQCGEPTRQK